MRTATILVTVLLLGMLAGCGAKPPPPGPTTASPTGTGTIEGRVIDDAQAPIAGAQIRILLTSLLANTDTEGAFRFSEVPAGPVRLVASADGHTSQTRNAVLSENTVISVHFVLDAIARVEPYHETKQFTGTIVCGLPQGAGCPSDPNAPTESSQPVRFDVAPGLSGIVFELAWDAPAATVNTELSFDVQAASADGCGARYAGTTGPSVLTLVVLEGFPISGGFQCVLVFPPPTNATLQQEYTMHYTLFYHEPPPEGFTASA